MKWLKTKLKQLTCSHYGTLGSPILQGYDFLISEKECHMCGKLVRRKLKLAVISKDLFPLFDVIDKVRN